MHCDRNTFSTIFTCTVPIGPAVQIVQFYPVLYSLHPQYIQYNLTPPSIFLQYVLYSLNSQHTVLKIKNENNNAKKTCFSQMKKE